MEYREYIDWYAFRYERQVFVIYSVSTTYTGKYLKYAEWFYQYLLIQGKEELDEFIALRQAGRMTAEVAYDAVPQLQDFLIRSGFNPGTPDGRYGSDTEQALLNLLLELGAVDSSLIQTTHSPRHVISISIRRFQKKHQLPVTGLCDEKTIRLLEREWQSGKE